MTWYQYLPLVLYVLNVLAFSWGAIFFFSQKGPVGSRYRIVQASSVTAWVTQAWFLFPVTEASEFGIGGICIALLGTLGLFLWAIRTTSTARLSLIYSNDLPSFVLKAGPYQFFRHPFYASYLICYLVAALFSLSLFSILSFVMMAVVYFHAARAEESKFVRSPLAEEYSVYKKEVAAFLPFIY